MIKELIMIDLDSPSLYFNRELSWLQFNSRVLAQASDSSLPPLERLKFLAIYGTNLDEFYMIRVAGLKSLFQAGIQQMGADMLTPKEQLDAIHLYIHNEQKTLERHYGDILLAIESKGLYIRPFESLKKKHKKQIREIFFEQIYPVIIPIAIDTTHPFPHLNNLSFGIAITLSDKRLNIKHGLIRIPRILPRFIYIDDIFVPIESVVENYISDLFPEHTRLASTTFRVTRNADLAIAEQEADDFLEILEEGLRSRNKGSLVRLELVEGADSDLIEFLTTHLKLYRDDIYFYKDTPLHLGSFWQIVGEKSLSHLMLPTYSPKTPPPLNEDDIFKAIAKEDIILYHPYDSFEPIVNFIDQASSSVDTVAIRVTLYRVGASSPIVKSLIRAVQDGKQVTVLVELKARFDEENNLHWAKSLEDAGAHVVYGIPGLKVHAKIAQVIKKNGKKLQSYLHLATGNYNPTTAKIYTDISYFTTRANLNSDATKFFHFLTGFSTKTSLDSLYISPTQIKPKLIEMIRAESRYGKDGHIILKSNSLVDPDIIKALYRASQKGTQIDLIIRGICSLKPQLKDISDSIKVHSIIGKYLEHPRIYYFKHDSSKCYISSADLMPRNLIRRVELMTPIDEPKLSSKIENILLIQLQDNALRWVLDSSGEYHKVQPSKNIINNHTIFEKYNDKSKPKYLDRLTKRLLR
jgi:polyphosphate kinase